MSEVADKVKKIIAEHLGIDDMSKIKDRPMTKYRLLFLLKSTFSFFLGCIINKYLVS